MQTKLNFSLIFILSGTKEYWQVRYFSCFRHISWLKIKLVLYISGTVKGNLKFRRLFFRFKNHPISAQGSPFPALSNFPWRHVSVSALCGVFNVLQGKFNELGYKIYTPYGFFMLIHLFLYLLLIFMFIFPNFFF